MNRTISAWLVVVAFSQWGCSDGGNGVAAAQNTGGATQNTGGATQDTGGATQNSGGTTQNSGGTTQNSGGTTQNSGGTTQNTGGTTQNTGGTAQAEQICAADCGWLSRCGKTGDDTFCAGGGCLAQSKNVKWRPGFADAVAQCFDTLTCTQPNDDSCSFTAILALDPSFPKLAAFQQCLAKQKACPRALGDDTCFALGAVTDAARSDAEACLAKPCEQTAACFEAAFGAPL